MAGPAYSVATERLYESLPEVQRNQDALQAAPGFPMKRYLSTVGDQLGAVADVLRRIDYEPPDTREVAAQATSDLADPLTADAAWLPWLAQLQGMRIDRNLPLVAQRAAIRSSVGGFRAGSKPAVGSAVARLLTGTRWVNVLTHSVSAQGNGGEWDVLIQTVAAETTVSSTVIVDAVIAADAKPAGVLLRHQTVAAAGPRPSWATWDAASWT